MTVCIVKCQSLIFFVFIGFVSFGLNAALFSFLHMIRNTECLVIMTILVSLWFIIMVHLELVYDFTLKKAE